jgi:CIC family chloride channel protein
LLAVPCIATSIIEGGIVPSEPDSADESSEPAGGFLVLALLAPLVGAVSGLIGALFRLALVAADRWRDLAIPAAQELGLAGLAATVAACAAVTALVAWTVRRFAPHASGSGIPHVEAVLRGELPPAPFRLIPVKFLGGLLAIGSGLALGREGPSVQMGANVAHLIGRLFRCNWPDCRVLLAAGAGAGLATAFNAPIAGAIFVLEELVRRFEPRIAIAALGASATAIAVARTLIGPAPDFVMPELAPPGAVVGLMFFALGAVAGLTAVVYNRTLIATLVAADRLAGWPVEARAGLIGALVGLLAFLMPDLVGGGDPITQRARAGLEPLALIPLVFKLRLALGALSYAAGTPGGLFAPMLVLGAELGLFFGLLCRLALPELDLAPQSFALVGMAAFFTGVVRAPLTGIVLVMEMTATVSLLLPMLAACFAAMLVPSWLGDPPIYDTLRAMTLARNRAGRGDG